MNTLIKKVEEKYLKKTPELRPGDVVRVHQKIREGNKERIQVFEGVVLKVKGSGIKKTFLVRKISFGIGVEKNFLMHSPNISKIEVKKRSKVRKAYLTYLRELRGKKARLKDKQFDILAVNVKDEPIEEVAPEDVPEQEVTDAEITELPEEEAGAQNVEEVPLAEVIAEENMEAAQGERDSAEESPEGPEGSDDQAAEIAAVEEGVREAQEDLEKGGKDTEGRQAEENVEEVSQEDIAEEIKEEADQE